MIRKIKTVKVMGGFEPVEIRDEKEILKMNVRYIGTDYEEDIDIYEECATGKFLGKMN